MAASEATVGLKEPMLQPSLQLWCGMVERDGMPAMRLSPEPCTDPSIGEMLQRIEINKLVTSLPVPDTERSNAFRNYHLTQMGVEFASECLGNRSLPQAQGSTTQAQVLLNNIRACMRSKTSMEELKRYIHTRKRIDVEQAAALVLSILPAKAAAQLVPHLSHILPASHMWLEPNDTPPFRTIKEESQHRCVLKIMLFLSKYVPSEISQIPTRTADFSTILPLLLRIRRKAPTDRCLRLPPWLFQLTLTAPPPHFTPHAPFPTAWPSAPHPHPIILSRKHFRNIDMMLNGRLSPPLRPVPLLRYRLLALHDQVTFGLGALDTLLSTRDPLALAFSFFALQRRLQPKVVSDHGWTTFLKKGESATHQQNTPHIPTSFETALLQLAAARPAEDVDWDALTAVAIPKNLEALSTVYSKEQRVLAAIDEACQLAEMYVVVHGQGVFENLVFKKGQRGGSGRGPVDQYNLVVDVIRCLKRMWQAATSLDEMEVDSAEGEQGEGGEKADEGKAVKVAVEVTADMEADPVAVIGPCHKFLAKDIMAWNNAWEDDAFAGGKRPGWLRWLKLRRLQGVLPAAEVEVR